MLIITGQLRSIKEGDPAGFFQSGLRPMFKIAPSQPRTSGDESKSHSDSDPLYAAYVLVLVLGLRKGEVLGLAWEAVNFEQGTLVPDHQLQRVRRSLLAGLATHARHRGSRTDHQARTAGRRTADEVWQQTKDMPSLIFTGRYGTPIDPRTQQEVLSALRGRGGASDHCS
jgi:integrase